MKFVGANCVRPKIVGEGLAPPATFKRIRHGRGKPLPYGKAGNRTRSGAESHIFHTERRCLRTHNVMSTALIAAAIGGLSGMQI